SVRTKFVDNMDDVDLREVIRRGINRVRGGFLTQESEWFWGRRHLGNRTVEIVYFKFYKENLITLCSACHEKVHLGFR
ncbi:MAG TPA: hypothetical protein VK639_14300, partial [Terriglobales bacterium]|nr:hypothetical protein [Terriglobales bacterium]